MFETPILFIIFNRPEDTENSFDAIRRLKPKYLFIAADGARENNFNDECNCKLTRSIVLNSINWDCEVKTLFHHKNLGCGNAVRSALVWFFETVEQGIILEDDILAEPNFFLFCEEMLHTYKDNKDVLSISGFNFGYKTSNNFTSRFMNMWGWASWRRAAIEIDYNLDIWKKKTKWEKYLFLIQRLHINYKLDVTWLNLWKGVFDNLVTESERMHTWDYQWIFHGLNSNKKIIFSKNNYIKNIGFNERGTHTINDNLLISNLLTSNDVTCKSSDLKICLDFEEKCLKPIWMGIKNNKNITIPTFLYLKSIEIIAESLKKIIHSIFNTLGLTLSKKPKKYENLRNEPMVAGLKRFHDNHIEINSIIDVGAAAGTWSLSANEIFPDANYLLFEPLIKREKELKEMCKSNANFKLVTKAAGIQTSFINFNISKDLDDSGVSDNLEINDHIRKIEVVRIDDEIKKHALKGPYLIKLATPGFEIPIIAGCEDIINEVNLFIIECYDFHLINGSLQFKEICNLMDSKGFRLVDIVDIVRRQKDNAYWQSDAFFIKKDNPIFQNNQYY